MKNKTFTPKAQIIPEDFSKKTMKLAWLLSIWLPLICVSALSMITSFIKANFGLNGAYYAILRITDACAQLSFFGVLAIIIVLIYINDRQTLFGVLALEFSGLLIVSFGIKTLTVVLMALIDETFIADATGLYFSDYPLSALIDSGHVYEVAIIAFLSVLGLSLMLGLTLLASKLIRDAQKKRHTDMTFDALRDSSRSNPMNAVFVTVLSGYALYALINEMVETYRTVFDMDYAGYAGEPNVLSEYIYLITPYLYILLYAVCGYYVLRFISSFCTANLIKDKESAEKQS